MRHMMFVFTEDDPADDLYQKLAMLPGVEMVYEFSGPGIAWDCPDYAVIVNLSDINNNGFYAGIEALCPEVVVHPEVILHEQPHIIGVQDIPGPVPSGAKLQAAPKPVITTDDIPGYVRSPMMRPALVHRDFSSQAGLASFAAVDAFTGFGSGLPDMATLAD